MMTTKAHGIDIAPCSQKGMEAILYIYAYFGIIILSS